EASVLSGLSDMIQSLRLNAATVGFEAGGAFDPSGYASSFVYGASLYGLLRASFPAATLSDGSDCLAGLRSTLTLREIGVLRQACGIAWDAFARVASTIGAGLRETEVAAQLRNALCDDSASRR